MSRPWLKFYPTDWRADPRLRMCSLSARGLWIDLISFMHEGLPYGHLTIDGVVPTVENIASLVARPMGEVRKALAELEHMQVFSRSESGAIFSRRMVKDQEKAARDSENGKGGGNPILVAGENRGVNPPDKAQKLEARMLDNYEPKGSLSEASSDSPKKRLRKSYSEDFEAFWAAYPTDPNMSKYEASQAWQKLSAEHRKAATDSIPAFRAYCASNLEYRPVHAGRYLLKRRYEGHLAKGQEIKARAVLTPHSANWEAWRTYYRDNRKTFAIQLMEQFEQEGKAYYAPSEWPPGWAASAYAETLENHGEAAE